MGYGRGWGCGVAVSGIHKPPAYPCISAYTHGKSKPLSLISPHKPPPDSPLPPRLWAPYPVSPCISVRLGKGIAWVGMGGINQSIKKILQLS